MDGTRQSKEEETSSPALLHAGHRIEIEPHKYHF